MYFGDPFLSLAPVFNFCLMPSHSVHSLLFSSSPGRNTTVQDLHSCNKITLQKNGSFSVNALSALRELVFPSSTYRDVSREHQVHLWAFAEYLGVTLHQRLCFYRREVAITRFLTESIIAVLLRSCSFRKQCLIWERDCQGWDWSPLHWKTSFCYPVPLISSCKPNTNTRCLLLSTSGPVWMVTEVNK